MTRESIAKSSCCPQSQRREPKLSAVVHCECTRTKVGAPASKFPDGLSNTMMVLEDTGRPQYWLYGKLGTGNSSNWPWSDPSNRITVQVASACNKGKTFFNCNNNNEIYSFHPGGVYLVMGDSSVRFVAETTDPEAFVSQFTANGGEPGHSGE